MKKLSKDFHMANAINILLGVSNMTDKEVSKTFNKVIDMRKAKKEGRYF